MKRKKNLVISGLLLLLSILLLVFLTLSWIHQEVQEIGNVDLYYPGMNFEFHHTIDDNGDGMPDVNEDGKEIYIVDNSDTLIFKNYFPMCETRFRMVSLSDRTDGRFFLKFTDISWEGPGGNPDDNNIDVSKAFEIEFIPPGDTDPVILDLAAEMNGGNSMIVFEDYYVGDETDYSFEYTIRMKPDAGNEYKNRKLIIGRVVFGTVYE